MAEEKRCPYCQGPLQEGVIYGDRYQMKWMPVEEKLVLGTWVKGDYIPVGTGRLFGRTQVHADYCEKCEKMIIDLLE